MDNALCSIIDSLSNRPEGFDVVPGFDPIRIAKTDPVKRPDGTVTAALRLWFRIEEEATVCLLYIEEIADDV